MMRTTALKITFVVVVVIAMLKTVLIAMGAMTLLCVLVGVAIGDAKGIGHSFQNAIAGEGGTADG